MDTCYTKVSTIIFNYTEIRKNQIILLSFNKYNFKYFDINLIFSLLTVLLYFLLNITMTMGWKNQS